MRDFLPKFDDSRLNIYWGRPSCGVTLKATGKDVTSFAFPHASVLRNFRALVAIKAAVLLASLKHLFCL